ncbi:D-glycero-beta-D-manno-heptose 1-phosphate adenylyltransferase [Specibacter sp. NPDC057265]|uniref:D-glycero-beta-D-manno-heptose 1-phosphate adenylyltransferase n=1 Tax=Specibacter sp. NPDC057265 TaxID=3346075 RepID=UPI0036458F14
MKARSEEFAALRGLNPQVPGLLAEARPHIVVLGELLLDSWWDGTVERMCREAPAPVVDMGLRRFAPGGAANTAVNLAAMGAQVTVIGAVGLDRGGTTVVSLLQEAGIDTSNVLVVPGHRTTSKTRVVASGQLLLRMDDGGTPLAPEQTAALGAALETACADADAVLIADYGSGGLPVHLAPALRAKAAAHTVFVVDAHDVRPWAPLAPDVVTPNWQEALRLVQLPDPRRPRAQWALDHQEALLAAAQAANVVVTLDQEGTVLLAAARTTHRTWARPVSETQTAGAGDTFVAALTLARACGVPLTTAMDLAQMAADIAVHRSGTAVCSTADLAHRLGNFAERVLEPQELARHVAAARSQGQRVVLTNGCFDVLHRGHTSYLNQARQLGELLIVGLNSDASVRRLKGSGRPLNQAADRAGVLAALSCVDYVTVFGEDTAVDLIRLLKPDIYAKGGDYSPEMLAETQQVLAHGGRVEILDYVPDHSTTALVEKMAAAPPPASLEAASSDTA